jgi:Fur family ferric uptake transcriptional regulator
MTHCHTIIHTLRQMGHRMTPQREMIIEAIAHAEGHITAEEIYERVKERTRAVNVATIYRTLDLLVEKGLAARADLRDGRVVYVTSHHGAHMHLVCRHCGDIIDADYRLAASLEDHLQADYSFYPDLQHFSIIGLCAACRDELALH